MRCRAATGGRRVTPAWCAPVFNSTNFGVPMNLLVAIAVTGSVISLGLAGAVHRARTRRASPATAGSTRRLSGQTELRPTQSPALPIFVASAADTSSADLDATSQEDGGYQYSDAGCLAEPSASAICGFASNDSVCSFSVSCQNSTDDSTCKINCEMGTTVGCYTEANVKCLLDAVAAKSCTALKACNWIL